MDETKRATNLVVQKSLRRKIRESLDCRETAVRRLQEVRAPDARLTGVEPSLHPNPSPARSSAADAPCGRAVACACVPAHAGSVRHERGWLTRLQGGDCPQVDVELKQLEWAEKSLEAAFDKKAKPLAVSQARYNIRRSRRKVRVGPSECGPSRVCLTLGLRLFAASAVTGDAHPPPC